MAAVISKAQFGPSRVSGEYLNRVLDVINDQAGITVAEIACVTKKSRSAANTAVQVLQRMECISKGAAKRELKQGTTKLVDGYFYEADLPDDFRTAGREKHRRTQQIA